MAIGNTFATALLTGCPSTNKKVLDLIEENDGIVVAMETGGGLKTAGNEVSEEGNPLESLASRYLETACACMTPNHLRIDILKNLVDENFHDIGPRCRGRGCRHRKNLSPAQLSIGTSNL